MPEGEQPSGPVCGLGLPLAGGDGLPMAALGGARLHERADAARNRRRILDVARTLVEEHGIEHVGMADVARGACVGTGTLYRRFGDRAGLALALLDETERGFQDALLRGPAPLGPGAPPRMRLQAFGREYLTRVSGHVELLAAAVPKGLPAGGPFEVYRLHLRLLLQEGGLAPDRADYAVETLIAMLAPATLRHLREWRDWSLERIQAGWEDLVDGWLCEG